MFEFNLKYREPGYHKKDEPDFLFPPEGKPFKSSQNLIEIKGKNGTGKSTLLNVLALSFGYLDNKELKTKPLTREKIERLYNNKTLQYNFQIDGPKSHPISIRIDRVQGQKQKISLNDKNIGPDALNDFDIIFLTEDDPEKVVSINLGKILDFYSAVEKYLLIVSEAINENQRKINSYLSFKKNEEQIVTRIDESKKELNTMEVEKNRLTALRNDILERDDTKKKMDLIIKEHDIIDERNKLKEKIDELGGKEPKGIRDELLSLERHVIRHRKTLHEVIEPEIKDLCGRFRRYKFTVNEDKILDEDYSDIEKIEESITTFMPSQTQNQLKMLEDMIRTFQKYPPNENIPVINKRVSDLLDSLILTRDRYSFENALPLLKEFKEQIRKKEKCITEITDLKVQIDKLRLIVTDAEKFDKINKEYFEAEDKYLKLQKTLEEGKSDIISKWERFKDIKGDYGDITDKIQDIERQIKTKNQLIDQNEGRLDSLRENNLTTPKYVEYAVEFLHLYDKVNDLRLKLGNWIKIINDPRVAKQAYETERREASFSLHEYTRFVKAMGEYLGRQFEPVSFAGSSHNIKYYDLESKLLVTEDDRQIYLNDLSQGQSKITSLNSSLKRLKQGKKGIVLIDEIADLDAENLQSIKNSLKDYYNKGQILLAVLVRPMSEFSKNSIEILGWA